MTSVPVFYHASTTDDPVIELSEEPSRHIVQVLRMQVGEPLQLTNGNGYMFFCELLQAHKKHALARMISSRYTPPPEQKIIIGISPLKNSSRFEWFLEKATEIGVTEIIPLNCERTEKARIRLDRLHAVLVSAMLQSQQSWLPVLHELTSVEKVCKKYSSADNTSRFVAHCVDDDRKSSLLKKEFQSSIILIGPEGDFTQGEIELALHSNFEGISLGNTRLRTETAGIAAVVLLNALQSH